MCACVTFFKLLQARSTGVGGGVGGRGGGGGGGRVMCRGNILKLGCKS